MAEFEFFPEIADRAARASAVARLRAAGVRLPAWRDIVAPGHAPSDIAARLPQVDPDEPAPENLWRIHWRNDAARTGHVDTPGHIVLPKALTGVDAPIIVLLGRRFPMISAHKVLPAYACLAPRLVTGRFDPGEHRAVWPSTGNYCRGGVAVSRIVGCRGVAVLPAGMSRERFDWLGRWVSEPGDIVRTPGTESNVKEIYDKCAELERDPRNVILNQFSEFANYVAHRLATGGAADDVFQAQRAQHPGLRLAAFVSATGSAGTIAAGDALKEKYGARIVAVEALECPTLLENGFGEHNIQGIGDKHVPLIHNVMNLDAVVGVSDRGSDTLNVLFNTDVGRRYLVERRGIDAALVDAFADVGISGFANIIAAIKIAKHFRLGADEAIVTVATDSADLYGSERDHFCARVYPAGFDEVHAGEAFAGQIEAIVDNGVEEMTAAGRRRIFNLGYYTWVEQQGVSLENFERRRRQSFWDGLIADAPKWDRLIDSFNEEVGASA